MPDYSLVRVDHQPDFDGYSLVPVDHDPLAEDGLAQQAQIQQAQAQPQGSPQQPPAMGAGQPDAGALGPKAGVPNPTLDDGAAKAAPFGGYASPTPTESLPSNGILRPLNEYGRFDSYAYEKNSIGAPPIGPQVTTANGSHTITATGGGKRRQTKQQWS